MPVGFPLTAAWEFDSSATAYVNNTREAALDVGTAFELLGEATDFHYFGFSRRMDALLFAIATAGKYGALTWAYGATVSSWIEFIPVQAFNLNAVDGYMMLNPPIDADETPWTSFAITTAAPHAVGSVPDSTARYWIRVSAASVTTITTCNSVVCRPYVSYASPANVQAQLQLRTAFSSITTPTLFTVEDYIRGAEDELIRIMKRSWRPEFVEEELLNFKAFGMKMRNQDIQIFYELAVYDGNDFAAKTEGRGKDWHVDERMGMVYIATIFLDAMPPMMRRSYSERRNQGSFKRAVRLRYMYGRDFRRDPFSRALNRVATKMACVDIVTNMDFTPLIPLGLDTVSLQQKVDNWQKDIEEFKDRWTGLEVANS